MAIPKKTREIVHQKYGGKCAYCGRDIEYRQMQVDHIRSQRNFYLGAKDEIPTYNVHDIENLNPACARCNKRKDTATIEQFRNELSAQCERLRRNSNQYNLALDYGLITETQQPVKFYFETLKP